MIKKPDHPSEEMLMIFADDPESVADGDSLETHVDRCDPCAKVVDDYRLITAAQRQQEIWWTARELVEAPGRYELEDFMARMKAEDEQARAQLAPLLESGYDLTALNLLKKRRYYNGGVVRFLCAAAREQCDRSPLFAIGLAQTAIAIAEELPDTFYPSRAVFELRGTAWKEYSTACRYTGQFEEGWNALDRAEAEYRKHASGSRLATVSLGRAILLWKQEQYDKALPYAQAAAADFAYFHERQGYFEAKQTEALIVHMQGDTVAAAAAYEAMFVQAHAIGDLEMEGRAAQNLGVVYSKRGKTARAGSYFLTALQIFESLGLHARAARTRWGIATVALISGQFEEAARRLTAVRSELLAFGMKSDAALAALDLAEALLMLDRWNEVHALCIELVRFFRNSDMITGALTAASFLKEAAAKRTLTRKHVGHVREYLQTLEHRPSLEFVAPSDE